MMDNFLYSYQHIPYRIDPVAFHVFGFPVDWYSLMYLVGFGVVYLLLRYRIKRGECASLVNPKSEFQNLKQIQNRNDQKLKQTALNIENLLDLMLVSFVGLLLGGRLGYVLFYNFSHYVSHPLEIISPFNSVTHEFIGIYGMSYHGALIGALFAAWIYCKRKGWDFLSLANFIAPVVPAGYLFGRLGNFFNSELYGRATGKFWGMYFPADGLGALRHPSQLYEAALEGSVLFAFLWAVRNRPWAKDKMLAFYLIGYAVARMISESFREPDAQIGYILGFLTLGQVLSLGMLLGGIICYNIKSHGKRLRNQT